MLGTESERLCDAFEVALRAEQRPLIEDYLNKAPVAGHAALLCELIQLELIYLPPRELSIIASEYQVRFPEHSATIEELFSKCCAERKAQSEEPTDLIDATIKVGRSSSASIISGSSKSDLCGTAALLSDLWPFSELPTRLIELLADECEAKSSEAGEVLIQQGEIARELSVITQGHFAVRIENQGVSRPVVEEQAPAIIGEMSLVMVSPCTATVVAITPVQRLTISADRFRQLATEHPMLWVILSQLVAERLGKGDVDALLGKSLDRFSIERCIARGGMAVVYEASDNVTGQRVALKMMSHRFSYNFEAQQRFEREAQICQQLIHPSIARTFDRFTALGTNFIIMELCSGETLAQRIKRVGPLPETEIRRIGAQLASALAYSHSEGVTHRDLKPSNVMICEDNTVKLLDFGLAKASEASELTGMHHVLGTPSYMAPEQVEGQPVGPHTDIYAFGSLLWETITGRRLFQASNLLQIHCQQVVWQLPGKDEIRAGLGDDIYGVLRHCLTRDWRVRQLDLVNLAKMWSAHS